MGFWQDYRWVILFYSIIIILVFIFRKKFDIHHKFLAMYRTKIGLKLMDKWGTKHAELVKVIAYMGIGVGYIGLLSILFVLIRSLFNLLTVPTAKSAVVPVIPGVSIGGIHIPLITGWIALFIVILVHEFSHGVVARAHKLPINSSGVFFFGPLMGAFVEPDEKKLMKASDTTQYSVYAAGPWSNIILAAICLLLLNYAFSPGIGAMENEVGIELVGVTEGYPAIDAGLKEGMVVTAVNGETVTNYDTFVAQMNDVKSHEPVTITADGQDFTFEAAENPDDPEKGYLGVMASSKAKTELNNDSLWYLVVNKILKWLAELFAMTGLLSFGIGLANLLPLGPVDGGRMLQVTLEKIKGAERGNVWWRNISVFTLVLLALNLFWPVFRWIGNLFV